MKTKILTIFRQNETENTAKEYISGQELCEQLGVSRTAVWKVINQLKEEGYVIEAVQNKGYKLCECPDIVSESEIRSRLCTEWMGKAVYYKQKTGSTNNDAKKEAEKGAEAGSLFVADNQEKGRGRRGRDWTTPEKSSIHASLLLRPEINPNKASMLTLVMAIAVSRAIEEATDLSCGIKWPNDIIINRKKVCGILTELSAELDYIHYVVIGFGINVNTKAFEQELMQKATSLQMEGNRSYNRSAIIAKVMYYFEQYYEMFCKTEDLSGMLAEYNKYLVNKDKTVKVLEPQGGYEGTAKGINEVGELIVEKTDGSICHVYAGEVSVRGIDGYV